MSCAGEIKVTDVMFPNGSPDLVEPIYKNPVLSAPFNEQLAAVTLAYVEDRLKVITSYAYQFCQRIWHALSPFWCSMKSCNL